MDELKKKRQERAEKALDIMDGVLDNFSKAIKQTELAGLYDRKFLLEEKIEDTTLNPVTIANAKLQLKSIHDSIKLLEKEVNLTDYYDTEVDEVAARKFIEDNNLLEDMSLIDQNDALDELERTLGLGEDDD